MNSIPRPEYPRPDFQRDSYYNLNGTWSFAFDDDNRGEREGWNLPRHQLAGSILVPFCYQSEKSGIGDKTIHPYLWYRCKFEVPEEMKGRRVFLRFGAVDFESKVYVNGRLAGTHRGGYTPFGFDISHLLVEGENDLCLRVEDQTDCSQPRGKQYWKEGLMGCWYTPVSGIWQSVWLEAAGDNSLTAIRVTPDLDRALADVRLRLEKFPEKGTRVAYELSMEGRLLLSGEVSAFDQTPGFTLDMRCGSRVDTVIAWTPEHPRLFDLKVTLLTEKGAQDEVKTYFGMRKVEVKNGQVLLNNTPVYQRLILDQGYWPDTLLTPPSDEAIRADVQWIKDFGYNGVRKHQKVEDPRFYYWCDRLGLLVWGEVPSCYEYGPQTVANLSNTLMDFIARDYNHPSIITWVPLNESWGVREIYTDRQQQAAARMLTQLCRSLDPIRLVSSNDGWEQTEADICALHDYAAEGEVIHRHFDSREQVEKTACDHRMCYAEGAQYTGREAFLITEYGGIAMTGKGAQEDMGGMQTWGYHDKVKDEETFFARFASVTNAIRELDYCQGYCYTQLTDVMQEINGLLTPDRQPKVDPERFRGINRNPKGRG